MHGAPRAPPSSSPFPVLSGSLAEDRPKEARGKPRCGKSGHRGDRDPASLPAQLAGVRASQLSLTRLQTTRGPGTREG